MHEKSSAEIRAEVQNSVVDFLTLAKADVEGTVALQMKAFRAETRWWIIAGVIANQTLAHLHVPSAVGALAAAAVGLKLVGAIFTQRG